MTRRLIVVGIIGALAAAACGDSGSVTTDPPSSGSSEAPFVVELPESRPDKPTTSIPPTTSTTTTTPPDPLELPVGFPGSLPLPEGNVGYFTGSEQLGFHLNISTASKFTELVAFFTRELESSAVWSFEVRDIGRGFVPGYEGQWALYTGPDHVVTQVFGPFEGVIEIEDRHVDILLDPVDQPEPGAEPSALPGPLELPRPETPLTEARYSSGLVTVAYATAPGEFEALVDSYRDAGWEELFVGGYDTLESDLAVGQVAGWKVTIDGSVRPGELTMRFENLALSFP